MGKKIEDFRHGLAADDLREILAQYQFGVTEEMAALMDKPGVANQFLPRAEELTVSSAELNDPIGDAVHSPLPSLVHRYRNRVLWKINSSCAVYCRFCFRKEHIGRRGRPLAQAERDRAIAYIRDHGEVEEVIFSGGDPLNMSLERFKTFAAPLQDIGHLRRLRIHSRVPIVAPEQITPAWLDFLAGLDRPLHWVMHINHRDELTAKNRALLAELRRRAMLLYSQSVLLKGVNDRVEVLADLMNELLDLGVVPYYLHHLDLARGTGHFRLTLDEGLALERALRQRLSGIAMPTYMVEIPNGGGKVPVQALTADQRRLLKELGID